MMLPNLLRMLLSGLAILCGLEAGLWAQQPYHPIQYTSKDGLPQNSIRGLAFDEHGFLWVATEGGLARFDGQGFRLCGADQHPDLGNQRFKQVIPLPDSSILFVDYTNALFLLEKGIFRRVPWPDNKVFDSRIFRGSVPSLSVLLDEPLLQKEMEKWEKPSRMALFPAGPNRLFAISSRIALLDLDRQERLILSKRTQSPHRFTFANGQLLHLNAQNQLVRLDLETQSWQACHWTLQDEEGTPFSLADPTFYSPPPHDQAFLEAGGRLYRLLPTGRPDRFRLELLLRELPPNCLISHLVYRPEDQLLVLGTDTRGLFVYRKWPFQTIAHAYDDRTLAAASYIQALLDSNSLLTSNGLIVDLESGNVRERFPYPFHSYYLYRNQRGQLYFRDPQKRLFRYDPARPDRAPEFLMQKTLAVVLLENHGTRWLMTGTGLYRWQDEAVQAILTGSFEGINAIRGYCMGGGHDLWIAAHMQVYRVDTCTWQVDSFPELDGARTRSLAWIDGKLFAGTYGNGYFVYDKGRFTAMPAGRGNELANVHAFVPDTSDYLWISTNRGLFKTHLGTVDAYLADSTLGLFYYTYLEEDGIRNTEFNGGCIPNHLWLPDGRLSLPSMQGLVLFDPHATAHNFDTDSVLFSRLRADGAAVALTPDIRIPADHYELSVDWATPWWGHAYNLDMQYRLEGVHRDYQPMSMGQRKLYFGHLKPGRYLLHVRKRIGFGPSDFVYSRLPFTVEAPWYLSPWAIGLYALGFLLLVWATSAAYTRTIRGRNILLQQKVDVQTAELRTANRQLGQNLEKLSRTERELRQNLKTKDRLISVISHDILTPLRFIGMIARLGSGREEKDGAQVQKTLTDVQNAVGKLYHSTLNLLHWVKYQQKNFEITPGSCSPYALVDRLLQDLVEMAEYQGNTLHNELPEDDIIQTDPQVLSIVLHNLLSNAIKFTRNGSIHLRSAVEPGWYILEVQDTGRGMSAEQLETLRRRSNRPDRPGSNDISAGTGIGLSLVDDLMEALNGHWDIDSKPDAGTQVRLFIPMKSRKSALPQGQ
jgi:signal transduction histidine kinase/ligand-binding sensor domain-containing protein